MIYVLFHRNCLDGRAAAQAAWEAFHETAIYIAVAYGEPLPEMILTRDTRLYILDFCYPLSVLYQLQQTCRLVQVIDHHRFAYQQFFRQLAEVYLGYQVITEFKAIKYSLKQTIRLTITQYALQTSRRFLRRVCRRLQLNPPFFNLTKSGALLAWEFFQPHQPIPKAIEYVSDYDLWQFKLKHTKAFKEGVDFSGLKDNFDYWHTLLYNEARLTHCINRGYDVLEYQEALVAQYTRPDRYKILMIGPYRVCVYNAIDFTNEIAEAFYTLLEVHYTLSYSIRPNGTAKLSFRSPKSGVNLIPIAATWGGGGHEHSCGASLSFAQTIQLLELLNSN